MTDSEKLDLLLSKLDKIDSLESDIQDIKSDVQDLKNDMQDVKRDLSNVKWQVMKSTAELKGMDGLILDEVERVHDILDKHKKDKTVHTA